MSTLPRYNPEADTGWVSGEGREGGREEDLREQLWLFVHLGRIREAQGSVVSPGLSFVWSLHHHVIFFFVIYR